MLGKKKVATTQTHDTKKTYGQFDDTLTVYTASSGTQYVLPTHIVFTEAQKKELNAFLNDLRGQEAHGKKQQ